WAITVCVPVRARRPDDTQKLCGCRGVEALLAQEQVDLQRVQLGQETDQVLQTAAQPVHRPSHDHDDFPTRRVTSYLVEPWALVAYPSAADAMIFVNFIDLTADAFYTLVNHALMRGRD